MCMQLEGMLLSQVDASIYLFQPVYSVDGEFLLVAPKEGRFLSNIPFMRWRVFCDHLSMK